LISATCLTLFYVHEGWFGRILRITLGVGLPWIVAWMVPTKRTGSSARSYWIRLGFAYFGVIVIGVVLILIWPYLAVFLMDSGLM